MAVWTSYVGLWLGVSAWSCVGTSGAVCSWHPDVSVRLNSTVDSWLFTVKELTELWLRIFCSIKTGVVALVIRMLISLKVGELWSPMMISQVISPSVAILPFIPFTRVSEHVMCSLTSSGRRDIWYDASGSSWGPSRNFCRSLGFAPCLACLLRCGPMIGWHVLFFESCLLSRWILQLFQPLWLIVVCRNIVVSSDISVDAAIEVVLGLTCYTTRWVVVVVRFVRLRRAISCNSQE